MEKHLSQTQIARRLLLSVGVAALCGFGAIYSINSAAHAAPVQNAAQTAQSTSTATPRLASWTQPGNLADLVESVSPAVVQITATGHQTEMANMTSGQVPDEMLEGPFGDFFRKFFEEGPNGQYRGPQRSPQFRGRTPERAAIGSGFVINGSGYIVTNNHVVDGADTFNVALKDGREFAATLVGMDDRTDLAVLKIDTKQSLPKVNWGESDDIRVGDPIFAVGAPFGLTGTVTSGIVSARGREIGAGPYDDFIQIDAPINQGNSGGPLFDDQGNVIGVNTAIFSPSGGNVGIGFAIPSEMAKSVVAQIVEHGSVERGWLGVSIQNVTKDIADSLGLDNAKGAIVGEVEDGSPAQKAGVKDGDVIVKFEGKAIDDAGDLSRAVAETTTGKSAKLTVLRHGREQVLSARIEKLKSETLEAKNVTQGAGQLDHDYDALGLLLESNNGEVVIAAVDPGSEAATAGLQQGDVIRSVNQEKITSARDAENAIKSAQSQKRPSILAQIERGGRSAFLAIPLSAG